MSVPVQAFTLFVVDACWFNWWSAQGGAPFSGRRIIIPIFYKKSLMWCFQDPRGKTLLLFCKVNCMFVKEVPRVGFMNRVLKCLLPVVTAQRHVRLQEGRSRWSMGTRTVNWHLRRSTHSSIWDSLSCSRSQHQSPWSEILMWYREGLLSLCPGIVAVTGQWVTIFQQCPICL